MVFNSLHSPLAATAGVLAILGLLAIPLHHLTAQRQPPAASRDTPPPAPPTLTPAILRLKLLTPARSIRLTTGDGASVLDLSDVPAGESEHDAALPIHNQALDLLLVADLGASPADTAVFLTVMPDAREGQTRYAIGGGLLTQPLRFNWQLP